jgi:hypothetical protein
VSCPKPKGAPPALGQIEFQIDPIDIDGLPIRDPSFAFAAYLEAPPIVNATFTAACQVSEIRSVFKGKCTLPSYDSTTAFDGDEDYYDEHGVGSVGFTRTGEELTGTSPMIGTDFNVQIMAGASASPRVIALKTFDVTACPEGYYRITMYQKLEGTGEADFDQPMHFCTLCSTLKARVGSYDCPAGTTLSDIKVRKGYWRANKYSTIILECPW